MHRILLTNPCSNVSTHGGHNSSSENVPDARRRSVIASEISSRQTTSLSFLHASSTPMRCIVIHENDASLHASVETIVVDAAPTDEYRPDASTQALDSEHRKQQVISPRAAKSSSNFLARHSLLHPFSFSYRAFRFIFINLTLLINSSDSLTKGIYSSRLLTSWEVFRSSSIEIKQVAVHVRL